MRKPLIAGNWKMCKTNEEAVGLVQTIKAGIHTVHDVTVVLCPPFTALSDVSKLIEETPIELGGQNMFHEAEGAFTGEVSPLMLKDIRCRYVILGHSERRQIFKEHDAFINKKVKLALKYSLIPILCVGEVLHEREENQHLAVVKNQLEASLRGLQPEEVAKVVLAYEPVWAIGTGKTASPEQAEQMHSYIRRLLKESCGKEIAERIQILYGGSVKPDNVVSLMSKPNVDGALVGGASLKGESFIQLVLSSQPESKTEASS